MFVVFLCNKAVFALVSIYNAKTFSFEKVFVVEHTGFEPVTSTMRM